MFSKINSAAVLGLDCSPVAVEVDIGKGWPGYQIVGLTDTSIQESKERIRIAWKNSGLTFPIGKGVIINLAPADISKEGSLYDLPMAVGMFIANDELAAIDLNDSLFVG
ncbi:MAG: magnesium chelatase domain-containing protein, partial [Patescibacteria group bacterium]